MIRFDPQRWTSPSMKTGSRRQGLIDARPANSGERVLFPLMLEALFEENDQHAPGIGGKMAVIELSHLPTHPTRCVTTFNSGRFMLQLYRVRQIMRPAAVTLDRFGSSDEARIGGCDQDNIERLLQRA